MHAHRVLIGLMAWCAVVVTTSTVSAEDLPAMHPDLRDILQAAFEEQDRCAQWDFRRELIHVDRDQYTLSLAGSILDTAPGEPVERYWGEACLQWTCDEIRLDVNASAVENVSRIEAENVRTGQKLVSGPSDQDRTIDRMVVHLGKPFPEMSPRAAITSEDKFYIRFIKSSERYCAREYTDVEMAVQKRERAAAERTRVAEESRRATEERRMIAETAKEILYENCVIASSRASTALSEVRSQCRRISGNPSWLQKWRWGG